MLSVFFQRIGRQPAASNPAVKVLDGSLPIDEKGDHPLGFDTVAVLGFVDHQRSVAERTVRCLDVGSKLGSRAATVAFNGAHLNMLLGLLKRFKIT
ncbi:hypothetical protein B6A42_26955 (plasmid) [Vibrio coralliilyticus]|nr:hypothetical protein B6A42_26955 [Vibrio coralliilyticus]